MTLLYTEEVVLGLLAECIHAGASLGGYSAKERAARILASAAPVAQPDLSRLAEAVREACQEAATTAETRIDAIDAIASLDLAPIIAGTGLVDERKEQKR